MRGMHGLTVVYVCVCMWWLVGSLTFAGKLSSFTEAKVRLYRSVQTS